jgi:hypothetical protein
MSSEAIQFASSNVSTPYRVEDRPRLEWTWRVDQLQESADIRVKSREDFAAAIFLIFRWPSMINREVPTWAYVWTSGYVPVGAVVASPPLMRTAARSRLDRGVRAACAG